MIKRLAIILAIYLVLILGAIYLFFYNPTLRGFIPPCPIRFFSGFYCPGCGSTRELHSLLHIDLYQAFRYNPALFILLPGIVFYILAKSIYFIKGIKHDPLHKVPSSVFVIIIILLVVYGIMRNIPIFYYLAPTTV